MAMWASGPYFLAAPATYVAYSSCRPGLRGAHNDPLFHLTICQSPVTRLSYIPAPFIFLDPAEYCEQVDSTAKLTAPSHPVQE